MKIINSLLFAITLISQSFSGFSQKKCHDFELATQFTNWRHNGNVTALQSTLDPTRNIAVLSATDNDGASIVYNDVDFRGDWSKNYCISFDYQINYNPSVEPTRNYAPKIMIYSGNNAPANGGNWPTNLVYATFVSNQANLNGIWKNYSLPLGLANSNGSLPSNEFGFWTMNGLTGTAATTAWNSLIRNVRGIILPTDYNNEPSEQIRFDNFCMENCRPVVMTPCNCIPLSLYDAEFTASLFRIEMLGGDLNNYQYKIRFSVPAFGNPLQQLSVAWNNWINTLYGFNGENTHSVVHQFMLYRKQPGGTDVLVSEFFVDAPNYTHPHGFDATLSNNQSYYIKHGVYYGQRNRQPSPLATPCPWSATDFYVEQFTGVGTSRQLVFKTKSGNVIKSFTPDTSKK